MVKVVNGNTPINSNQPPVKRPKEKNSLTKLFHAIQEKFDSFFHKKESLSDRNIEHQSKLVELKDNTEAELEEAFGKEEKEEVIIAPQLVIDPDGLKDELKSEIVVLIDKRNFLSEQISAEQKSDPLGLKGIIRRIFGEEKLSSLVREEEMLNDKILTINNRIKELENLKKTKDIDNDFIETSADDDFIK